MRNIKSKVISSAMAVVLAFGMAPSFALAAPAENDAGGGSQELAAGSISLGTQDAELDNSTTLSDGEYTPENFTATSGKTTWTCEKVVVKDGKAEAVFTVSSDKVTHLYYLGGVDSEKNTDADNADKYNVKTEAMGTGVAAVQDQKVTIPVDLNKEMPCASRTTAMSEPKWTNFTYTITLAEPEAPAPAGVELAITNNTGMFKAESASAVVNEDGSSMLTMALSGTGYKWLYKGTYEEAVAASKAISDGIAADKGDDKLIGSTTNAAGKLEFQIPIAKDEAYTPLVAISNSYYTKYVQGQNSLERSFYPRQLELDLEAKTLVTGDYEFSSDLKVANNAGTPEISSAKLDTVGGPNSNNYAATLAMVMANDAYDKAFVGSAADAQSAATPIALSEDKAFAIPVKWVETFGDPTTLKTLCDGAPFTVSFHEKDGNWVERTVALDEKAKTLTVSALEDGLYVLPGLSADANGFVDSSAYPAYILADGKDATLVVKVLDPANRGSLYLGKVADRAANAAEATGLISGVDVLGKYKYYLVPLAAKDIDAGKIYFSLTNKEGNAWADDADHYFEFGALAASGVDASAWTIDAADIASAIELVNAIPETPTLEAYVAAAKDYIALDYSGTADYGKQFIDNVLPEVKAALDAADAAIPNVVPADGVYEFTQTLSASNYPSVAEGWVSDSLWSATLNVVDGKMTVTVAQRRGTYAYMYTGTPSEATAAEMPLGTVGKSANNVVGKLDSIAAYARNVADVYLDNPQSGANPVDDSIVFAGPGVYPMYTATFEIKSLEKPVALAFRSSRWFNRSFIFHADNMYTQNVANYIRPINKLLNSPDPDDVTAATGPYKVDPALLTASDAAYADAADAAYAKLTEEEKAQVAALKTSASLVPPKEGTIDVEDAPTYVEALATAKEGIAPAVEAYNGATAAMDALSDKSTEDAVAAARAAYDALPAADKATVPAKTYEKLLVSEVAVAKAAQAEAEAKAAAAEQEKQDAQKAQQAAEKAQQAAEDKVAAAEKTAASALQKNPMTVKAKVVKAASKKATKAAQKKAFTVKNAKGSLTFAKLSGDAKITVSKAGKVTVAKGLKKGKTYKVKVLVVAKGNKAYAPAMKTVTLKVKVAK